MDKEVRRIINFLFTSEDGKKRALSILTVFILLTLLIILNKFFLINFINTNEFSTHWALSRLLIHGGIDPYSLEISSVLRSQYPDVFNSLDLSEFVFIEPLYILFFFYPLTFVGDHGWALAIWMTIIISLIILNLIILLRIFKIKLPNKFLPLIILGGFFYFANIESFLRGSVLIVQISLFLTSIYFFQNNKLIFAGVFLGLSSISLFNFTILAITFLAICILVNKREILNWGLITIVLLSLAGVIFQQDWILRNLRNLVIESQKFPFTSYSNAILASSKSGTVLKILINLLPLIILLWNIYEFSRSPKNTENQVWWILSFGLILNAALFGFIDIAASITLLPAYFYLIALWSKKSKGLFNWVISAIIVLISVVLPLINVIYLLIADRTLLNKNIFLILNIVFSLILMYWVRLWTIQDEFLPNPE